MTDEEKYEEYHKQTPCHGCSKICEGDCVYAHPDKQSYLDGLVEGRKEICKKILNEVRTHEGIEQTTKFYIGEIIKDLGVEV